MADKVTDPDAAALIQRAEQWLADDELKQTTPLGWHTLVRDLLALLTARETAQCERGENCACAIGNRHFWHESFCKERGKVTALEAALATAHSKHEEEVDRLENLLGQVEGHRDADERELDALRNQVAQLQDDVSDMRDAAAISSGYLVSQLRSLIQTWRSHDPSQVYWEDVATIADQVEALLPPDAPQHEDQEPKDLGLLGNTDTGESKRQTPRR